MRGPILLLLVILPFALPAQDRSARDWAKVKELYGREKIYGGLKMAEKHLSQRRMDPAFLVLRAEGNNRIGEYAKAEADARRALGQVKGDTMNMAALQLGIAMMETGRLDSARIWLELSLGITDDTGAHIRLARLHIARGDGDAAIAQLDRLLEGHTDHVRALLERGAAYAVAGDTAAARRDLDRAVELAPRDPVAWNSRGFHVHASQERHAEAIKDYDMAIKFDPNYSYAFNNRGWSLYKLGEVEKGRKNIALAGRKRKGNPFVHRNLGMIALETGDTTQACRHFRQAIEYNFEQLHGPEVSDRMRAHCGAGPGRTTPDGVPAQVPDARPARGNAPKRSNAP